MFHCFEVCDEKLDKNEFVFYLKLKPGLLCNGSVTLCGCVLNYMIVYVRFLFSMSVYIKMTRYKNFGQ